MNSDPNSHTYVVGSWWTSMVGWAYSIWHWFAGDANGMTLLIGISTAALTLRKHTHEG